MFLVSISRSGQAVCVAVAWFLQVPADGKELRVTYGVEIGAICVLHTLGQNLSLHPHIHCIVPSAGITLAGNLKRITKNGKYLYPVLMLSPAFRSILLKKLKLRLNQTNQLPRYQTLLDDLWKKPWVVYCKPPFGNAQHIVKYLGQYSHRVAISNHHRDGKIMFEKLRNHPEKEKSSMLRKRKYELM